MSRVGFAILAHSRLDRVGALVRHLQRSDQPVAGPIAGMLVGSIAVFIDILPQPVAGATKRFTDRERLALLGKELFVEVRHEEAGGTVVDVDRGADDT